MQLKKFSVAATRKWPRLLRSEWPLARHGVCTTPTFLVCGRLLGKHVVTTRTVVRVEVSGEQKGNAISRGHAAVTQQKEC